MLKEVLEYEKRLLEDRELLRKLVESSEEKSGIEQDKLNFFKTELAYMNNQLELLRQKQVSQQQNQAMRPQPQFHQAPSKKSEDLEKKVGKTFMGILASGLIFISIILFATLLIPSLNDTIKMAVTYIVSFAICGFGWFKLHMNHKDKFYLALTGCGMGALYISLLLSNMYFKMLGDIPLYALIAVWAVGICVLSRYNNLVFQIIGQIGIVISMVFGVILCAVNGDVGKFTVLLLFYMVTSTVLYATHFKKCFHDNLCAHIANVINLFIILLGAEFIVEGGHYTFFVVLIFILAHIVVSYLCTWTEKECAPGIMISLYGFLFTINLIEFVQHDIWCPVLLYVLMMVLGAVAEFRKTGKDCSKTLVQVFTVIVAVIALSFVEVLALHGVVPLLIAPLLAVGFWRENKGLKVMALILSYCYVIFEQGVHNLEWFITGGVLVTALYALVFWFKKQYSGVYKGFVHVLGMLFFWITGAALLKSFSITGDIRFSVIYMVTALFNVAVMKSPFAKNLFTGEDGKNGLFNAMNAVMMFMGLTAIHTDLPILLDIPVALVTLAVFLVNSKNLLDKYPNKFGGAYVGIKFTVFMLVLLTAYEATNYVVSIACFLFAVASIALGFGFKYKSLRIYGLVLCMLSVFKLIVMDIEYADTLGYAVSFFVAGVLCFAISLLYNFVDKRMNTVTKN